MTKELKKSQEKRHIFFLILLFATIYLIIFSEKKHQPSFVDDISPALVMEGGDPYIRALMRTISASEAAGENPYVLLYGGGHIHDLSQHPDLCIDIKTDINQGYCSTAAGRYQFLTTTWREKSSLYHPDVGHSHNGNVYNFEPRYQDIVTYHWLKDNKQWQMNIAAELKQGNLDKVLKRLSATWTSLGYGIEDNKMTSALPDLYQNFLEQELKYW